jgi:hypothetical protein
MFKSFLAAAAAATLSAAASAAGANLVADGSFESVDVAPGTWTTVGAVGAWTSITSGIEVRDGIVGTAEDGFNFVELDTDRNSSMSQFLNLGAGEYTLSFWVEDRPGTDAATNGLDYTINGVTKTVVGGTVPGWTQITETFDAIGPTTLTFAAAGTSDSLGSSLDNVVVTAVSEPSGLVLAASGVALLGLSRRRRMR